MSATPRPGIFSASSRTPFSLRSSTSFSRGRACWGWPTARAATAWGLRSRGWGENRFDAIVALFIQFAGPAERGKMFQDIRRALKPGGHLILQGYTPRQLEYKTGGPSQAENMYTAEMLQASFDDMEILHLREHDDTICEGTHHCGMSALVDMVARKP